MTNKERFISIVNEKIHRDGIDKLMEWLEKSDFYKAPASTKYHGNYEGGLLEHSLNVYDALTKLVADYSIQDFTPETIAIVSLFHDICKSYYYKKEIRPQKIDGVWVEKEIYVIDDLMPLGHGEKSVIMLQRFISLDLNESLAIRWHMGGFDSAVKGGDYSLSKAQDNTKLVTLISIADLIASNLLEETKK